MFASFLGVEEGEQEQMSGADIVSVCLCRRLLPTNTCAVLVRFLIGQPFTCEPD